MDMSMLYDLEEEINVDLYGHEESQEKNEVSLTQEVSSILDTFLKNKKCVEGIWVYQNNSLFNSNQDISRMKNGRAAKGTDDKPINLHHINQTMDGGIVELTQTFHQSNFSKLHKNTGQSKSQINRDTFASWRRKYWIQRANDLK